MRVKVVNVIKPYIVEGYTLQPGVYISSFPEAHHNHDLPTRVLLEPALPPPNSKTPLLDAANCATHLSEGRVDLLNKASILMAAGMTPTAVYNSCLDDPALSKSAKAVLATYDRKSLNSAVRYLLWGLSPRPDDEKDDCATFVMEAQRAAGADPLSTFNHTTTDFSILDKAFWASSFHAHLLKNRGRILILDTTHNTNRLVMQHLEACAPY